MDVQELAMRFCNNGNNLDSIKDDVPKLTDSQFFRLLKLIDKEQARRRAKTYQYLVTFTTDPQKFPEDPVDKVEEYIESQGQRPALSVVEASYVAEKHKNGRIHWHMKLVTTKALRSDAFNSYEKNFGKVDISRSKHTTGSHIDIYMNKEGTIKPIKTL